MYNKKCIICKNYFGTKNKKTVCCSPKCSAKYGLITRPTSKRKESYKKSGNTHREGHKTGRIKKSGCFSKEFIEYRKKLSFNEFYKNPKKMRKRISDSLKRKYKNGEITVWNKGLAGKGICKPTSGGFKKGFTPWNKGKKKPMLDLICKECSKNFKCSYIRPFCGISCAMKNNNKNRNPKINKKQGQTLKNLYKTGKIKPNSGVFKKGDHNSPVKKGSNFEETYGHKKAKEIKSKIVNARSKQKFIKISSLEVKLKKEFDKNRIKYEQQWSYRYGDNKLGIADFYLPKSKLIVEVFGDYWHNLSDYKIRDRIKKKSLEKQGYKVLQLWEHEINENIQNCISKIYKYI